MPLVFLMVSQKKIKYSEFKNKIFTVTKKNQMTLTALTDDGKTFNFKFATKGNHWRSKTDNVSVDVVKESQMKPIKKIMLSEAIRLIESKTGKRISLKEYFVNNSSKIEDVLGLNIFEDLIGDNELESEFLPYTYIRIAKKLKASLKPYLKNPIPKEFIKKIDKCWYDGSDAYDGKHSEEYYLPKIYKKQIGLVKELISFLEKLNENKVIKVSEAIKLIESKTGKKIILKERIINNDIDYSKYRKLGNIPITKWSKFMSNFNFDVTEMDRISKHLGYNKFEDLIINDITPLKIKKDSAKFKKLKTAVRAIRTTTRNMSEGGIDMLVEKKKKNIKRSKSSKAKII